MPIRRPRRQKSYDADWIRAQIKVRGATANIPNKSNRKTLYPIPQKGLSPRNLIERFFNKLKQYRCIATYDKLAATFFAFIQFAAVMIWLSQLSLRPR